MRDSSAYALVEGPLEEHDQTLLFDGNTWHRHNLGDSMDLKKKGDGESLEN